METKIIILVVIIVILVLFGVMTYYVFYNRYAVQKNPLLLCKQRKCNNQGGKPQVYNIKGNFTYDQAKEMCTEECGRLANINDLITSQKKGAEWCSPGWSADQLVLYPAQKAKKCGPYSLAGLNGGKRPPNNKYGANCYGKKPKNGGFKPKCPPQKKGQCKAPLGSISPFNSIIWSE